MKDRESSWQRLSHKRTPRRLVLRAAALGSTGLMAAAVISCGKKEEEGAAVLVQKEPKRGGVLRRQSFADTRGTGLDPHTNAPAFASGYRLFYQGLLGYNFRTFEDLEPELAQKWEQPSQTEYLFTLQPGVTWQNKPPANGRPLRVEDVLFSLERVRTNDPRFFSRSVFDFVDRIEAVDKATVKITMKAPDVSLLVNVAGDSIMVLAPEVVEKAKRFASAEEAVGTGAFVLSSLEERVGAEYVRNPHYWKPGLPYLDGIRTQHFESQVAYAAFLAGQLDIADTVPGEEVKNYLARRGLTFMPDWFPITIVVVSWSNTKAKPMDDPRVPRALRLLIDHKEFKALGETLYGRARHGSLFAPSLAAWDLTDEEYEQFLEWKPDKTEAVRVAVDLLRAAGFSRETPLRFEVATFDTGDGLTAAQLLEAQWRRLSGGIVEATLKPLDSRTLDRIRAQREFTHIYYGNTGVANEPSSWLSQLYASNGSRNYTGYGDPRLDALIEKQRGTFNREERRALIRQIITYAIDRWPGTIPYNYFLLNAVTPKVQGFNPEWRINGRQYEQVWLDS